jgi:RNA polymerase sigma factor (sigma-70 family)
MGSESRSPLLAFLRRIVPSRGHSDLTDGELLQRFALHREEWAFTTLLQRHGPMVLGVCQSVLQDAHDAEDVFQATFLVLVRKPGSIGKPASVASWLHGVAYRLATRARAEAARRRSREREAVTMPSGEPHDEVLWRDLRPVLHQEVDRLPERYRLPFVLCYLEGKTNEEAAALLGWPRGTVLSSLSRARERLRKRLSQRGVALTSGVLATLLAQPAAQAAVPPALAANTLQAALLFATDTGAAGGISVPVLAHAEGMLHASRMARLKLLALMLLAVTTVGTGAGMLAFRVGTPAHADAILDEQPPASIPRRSPTPAPPAPQQPEQDRDRLQGAWIIQAAEQEGRALPELRGRGLAFTGNRFVLDRWNAEVRGILPSAPLAGDFELEPASPRRIDLLATGWHLHGIYALAGKRLTICLQGANARERPTEFTTGRGSRQLLLVLDRE